MNVCELSEERCAFVAPLLFPCGLAAERGRVVLTLARRVLRAPRERCEGKNGYRMLHGIVERPSRCVSEEKRAKTTRQQLSLLFER